MSGERIPWGVDACGTDPRGGQPPHPRHIFETKREARRQAASLGSGLRRAVDPTDGASAP